jgi:hypothetical protein
MRRSHDARDIKKVWTANDCDYDENIEFYCDGRLPVFNEWISENAKQVERWQTMSIKRKSARVCYSSFFKKFGQAVVQF